MIHVTVEDPNGRDLTLTVADGASLRDIRRAVASRLGLARPQPWPVEMSVSGTHARVTVGEAQRSAGGGGLASAALAGAALL